MVWRYQVTDWLPAAAELNPALQPYVSETKLFTVLQHPWVYGVPYTPQLNGMYNEQFEYKRKAIADAFTDRNWDQYIWLHERAYRWEALDELFTELPDNLFWPLFGDVYTDSENIQQYHELIAVWLDQPKIPQSVMTVEELAAYHLLPQILTVFRGYSRDETLDEPTDWSWSLSYKTARWFAQRWSVAEHIGYIVQGTLRKTDVMAHFTRRKEQEILAWAEKVTNKERLA